MGGTTSEGGTDGPLLRVTERAHPSEAPKARLTLSYEARQRRRWRARLDDGREIALLLGGGPSLRAGDRLRAEDGSIIEVCAAAEPLSRAQSEDPWLLARVCYHLGNRHVPLEVGPGWVCYAADHVLDDLVCRLGLPVARTVEPFEPESGAYAHAHAPGVRPSGHGHHHHEHDHHEHHHDHEHEHGEEHAPVIAAEPQPERDPFGVQTLLPLFRLASPALPIGAFAYSQGLEQAVARGWVHDEATTCTWIVERLVHSLARTDLPVLLRMHRVWSEPGDGSKSPPEEVLRWSTFLLASRESRELQEEDHQLGASLARLLGALGDARAEQLAQSPLCSLAAAFSRASAQSGSRPEAAAAAYLWAWLESQTAAAQRSLPLGQTAAQRILLAGAKRIPAAVAQAFALQDDEIGMATPGLAIASALHEEQYTRLFRS